MGAETAVCIGGRPPSGFAGRLAENFGRHVRCDTSKSAVLHELLTTLGTVHAQPRATRHGAARDRCKQPRLGITEGVRVEDTLGGEVQCRAQYAFAFERTAQHVCRPTPALRRLAPSMQPTACEVESNSTSQQRLAWFGAVSGTAWGWRDPTSNRALGGKQIAKHIRP